MTKPVIVTRAGKGDTLSWAEADANFTNLQNATIGVTDGTTSGTLDLNDTLTFTAGTNVTLSYNATTKALTINSSYVDSGIENIVEDTTPQLGGNLDVNGNSIVSASGGNIAITPDTTGSIVLDGLNWPQADGTNGQVLSTNGSGQLSWITAGGVPTQVAFQTTPASTDVYFTMTSATGAGDKNLYAPSAGSLKYNTGTGAISTLANISTEGNIILNYQGNLFLYDLDNSHRVSISAPTDLTSNVTFRLPNSNGSNGQYLQSDGSGNLSWSTVSAGASNLDGLSDVVITTPATNNVLRYDGTNWVNTAASTLSVSSASTATTATTATGATNINISTTTGNANDTTLYPVLVAASSTGNQLPHIDSVFTYDANNDALSIGTNSNKEGKVILKSSSTGDVTLQAPSTSNNVTFIFPVNTGTNQQILTTNGSGQASWASSITNGFTFNSNTANSQKLVIGSASLSSTAWTTNGVGLRIQAAQYTDTSSTAGTVANSHVHAIAAPTMASTNAITVTDAGTLYISGAPTAGTNTTITNGWALLANGRIKATAIDNTPIGSTTASTGAFTTLTVNAANDLRLADSDSSNYVGFKSPATVSSNVIWTLPSADGTNGQVLSTNGTGTLSWATAGGGSGPSFALVYLSTSDFTVSNTASNANLFGVATLVEDYDANNILSINGDNDIVLAAAGTYIYEILSVSLFATNYGPGTASTALTSPTAFFNIYNSTTATQIAAQDLNTIRHPGNGNSITYRGNLGAIQIRTKIVTTTANNIIRVRVTGQSASSGGSEMTFAGGRPITIKVTKLA